MPLLSRYILKQLVSLAALVTVALCGVVWMTQSLRFVDYVVNRGVSLDLFIRFLGLLLPQFVALVLPFALLIAVLVTYNRLQGDSELTAMRAAGASPLQLARPAIGLTLVLAMAGWLQTLVILPAAYTAFKDLQSDIRQSYATALLQEGVFTPVVPGLTMTIGGRTADGYLTDLLLHDSRKDGKPITLLARRAVVEPAANGMRLLLLQGERQDMDPVTGRLTTLSFDRYALVLDDLGGPVTSRDRDVREEPLHTLLSPSPLVPHEQAMKMRAAGHARLAMPLLTLTFAFIALWAVLCAPYRRQGNGGRVRLAVGLVITVQATAIGLENLANRHSGLLPALYLNALLPMGWAALQLAGIRLAPVRGQTA